MSLGQRTANQLNTKYKDEEKESFLQSYYRDNPIMKMVTGMSRLPVAALAGSGMLPGLLGPAAMLGAGGLMSASNKQKENKRITDYKAAEGASKQDLSGENWIANPTRSIGNAVGSMANPLLMAFLAAQAGGMLGSETMAAAAPALLGGSMAARSPVMASQVAAGAGLTGLLAGGTGSVAATGTTAATAATGAQASIEQINAAYADAGTAGFLGKGMALMPSGLLYGAGGLAKGAGAAASMVGADSVGSALTQGGGMLSGAGDSLLDILGSAAASGGIGSLLGPAVGIGTSMLLSKGVGKMMDKARESSTGVQLQKSGKSIRPRKMRASEIIERYSKTRQLDMQANMLGNLGELTSYQRLELEYLSAIEKPLSLLGFMAENQYNKDEEERVSANKTQNSMQTKFGFTGDDEADQTKAFVDPETRTWGDKGTDKLSDAEFWSDPLKFVKASIDKKTLGFEKKMLQVSAIANPMGWILGGKHSTGSKLADIRKQDDMSNVINEVSKTTGIPTSGVTAMETTATSLANSGETIDDKKLALMGGTYELIRLSTFFLQDIRKVMGVTKETSMLGKVSRIQEETEAAADKRTDDEKFASSIADLVDKIPIISLIGSVVGAGFRASDKDLGKVTEQKEHVGGIAESLMGDMLGSKGGDANDRMVFSLDIIRHLTEGIKESAANTLISITHIEDILSDSGSMLSNIWGSLKEGVAHLDYLTTCPCNKPKMALGGSYTGPNANARSINGVVPGPDQVPGKDNVIIKNAALRSKEFVVNSEAAQENQDLLTAINENRTPDVLSKMANSLSAIEANVQFIAIGMTSEVARAQEPKILKRTSADDTDAILEAEQEHEEKVERDEKMTNAFVSIDKELKKMNKDETGLFKKKKEEPGDESDSRLGIVGRVAQGVIGAGLGQAVVSFISKSKMLRGMLALGGVATMVSGANVKMFEELGMDSFHAKRAGTALDYAMIGSAGGIKGMIVGGVLGYASVMLEDVVDNFVDPKKHPMINKVSKDMLNIIEAAGAGFLMGGIPGALIGGLGAILWKYSPEIWEFIKGTTLFKIGEWGAGVVGDTWDYVTGEDTPEEKKAKAYEEELSKQQGVRQGNISSLLEQKDLKVEAFKKDPRHENDFGFGVMGMGGGPVKGSKWTYNNKNQSLLFVDSNGITWDVENNIAVSDSLGETPISKAEVMKGILKAEEKKKAEPTPTLDAIERVLTPDSPVEILAKEKAEAEAKAKKGSLWGSFTSSLGLDEKLINASELVAKAKEAKVATIIKATDEMQTEINHTIKQTQVKQSEAPAARVIYETPDQIKEKTQKSTVAAQKVEEKKKEKEIKDKEERYMKEAILSQDMVDGIYGIQKQTNALAMVLAETAVGNDGNQNSLGQLMGQQLNELKVISGSNQEIAQKTNDNKNNIVKRI